MLPNVVSSLDLIVGWTVNPEDFVLHLDLDILSSTHLDRKDLWFKHDLDLQNLWEHWIINWKVFFVWIFNGRIYIYLVIVTYTIKVGWKIFCDINLIRWIICWINRDFWIFNWCNIDTKSSLAALSNDRHWVMVQILFPWDPSTCRVCD